MGRSIWFEQFNTPKVGKAWDKIVAGEVDSFIDDIKKKLNEQMEESQKEYEELKSIENTDVYCIMSYHDKKKLKILETAYAKYEYALKQMNEINEIQKELESLLSKQKKQSSLHIQEKIAEIDTMLVGIYCEKAAGDPLGWYEEVFSFLFKKILGKSFIDGYEDSSLIPTEEWIKIFRGINKDIIRETGKYIDECYRSSEPTKIGDIVYLLQPVRDVLKFCMENSSDMVVHTEGDYQFDAFYKKRAQEIYQRLLTSDV